MVPALDCRHGAGDCPRAAASVIYVVRVGDTLSAISGRFGVAFQSWQVLTRLSAPYVIRAGQTLMIPATSDNPSLAAAAPPPSVAATSAPVTGGMVYTVAQGDTLGGAEQSLWRDDGCHRRRQPPFDGHLITIGQQLVIPAVAAGAATSSGIAAAAPATSVAPANTSAPDRRYVVRAGDTLSAIAQRFGMTTDAVAAQNNISADAIIAVGEQLVVPAGCPGHRRRARSPSSIRPPSPTSSPPRPSALGRPRLDQGAGLAGERLADGYGHRRRHGRDATDARFGGLGGRHAAGPDDQPVQRHRQHPGRRGHDELLPEGL